MSTSSTTHSSGRPRSGDAMPACEIGSAAWTKTATRSPMVGTSCSAARVGARDPRAVVLPGNQPGLNGQRNLPSGVPRGQRRRRRPSPYCPRPMGASAVLSPRAVSVQPGTEAVCTVTVRNTGTVVDEFRLSVLGDTAGWAQVEPYVLSLLPGAEGTAEIRFRPPRSSEIGARTVTFGLRAASGRGPRRLHRRRGHRRGHPVRRHLRRDHSPHRPGPHRRPPSTWPSTTGATPRSTPTCRPSIPTTP